MRVLGQYLNSKTEVDRISRLCRRVASAHVERVSPTTVRGPARLTKQQDEQIVAIYKARRRPTNVARDLGTTEWTVHHRLNRLGVERRPISMTDAEIHEALRLNDEGMPITEFSMRFNRSGKTIWKGLRAARGY